MSTSVQRSWLVRASTIVVIAWLAMFFVAPVMTMLVDQLRWSTATRVVTNATTWRVVWFSLWQASLSVLATFVVATPVTWLIGRHAFRGRSILRAISTLGFLLPSVVVGAAFLAVLPTSWHYGIAAVIIAHAYFNVAVVVRVVGTRLELLDDRLSDAARILGATRTQVVRTVSWPQIRGSVTSAAVVVFLYCFTSFAVVRVLGGPGRNTMESDISLRAFGIGDVPAATVMSVLQFVILAAVVLGIRWSARDAFASMRTNAQPLAPLRRSQQGTAFVVAMATMVFVLVPLIAVLWKSIHVGDSITTNAWRSTLDGALLQSLAVSARTALTAGVLGALLTALAAFVVARSSRIGSTIDFVGLVPLLLSPVTLGLGFVITFDQQWFDWRAEWWLVAAAHTLVAFPLAMRVLVPAWRAIPDRLRDAAATLGAGDVRRFVDIDLRLMRRPIVAAFGLMVAVSLGEFGAASLLSRSEAETMPVAIARLLARTGDGVRAEAFAMSSVLIVSCIGILLAVESALARSGRAASH